MDKHHNNDQKMKQKKNLTLSAIPLRRENNRFSLCPDSYFAQGNSGIEQCQVEILTSPDKVRIPALRKTILELSRFLLCAELIYLTNV